MKIGVVVGSASGKGSAQKVVALLAARLRACEVAVCGDAFGCDELPPSWSRLSPDISKDYVENLRNVVASLLDWGADALVCVGGDGLASYVLDAAVAGQERGKAAEPGARGKRVPLLSIASGTINVGPALAFRAEDIPTLDISKLSVQSIDAVEVLVDGSHLAYAVNDVIIGNSFLGTVDGEVVNLSARELLHSCRKLKIEPSTDIAGEGFCLSKNGAPVAVSMKTPAQIIVSPLGRREFFGRAIAGVLCNAAFMDGAAALGLFDTVIVRAAEPLRGFGDTARSEHLLFGPDDRIEVGGLGPDADIIVDGNPYERRGNTVGFRLRPDIADVLAPLTDKGAEQEGIVWP